MRTIGELVYAVLWIAVGVLIGRSLIDDRPDGPYGPSHYDTNVAVQVVDYERCVSVLESCVAQIETLVDPYGEHRIDDFGQSVSK